MHHFRYTSGTLFCEGVPVADLAKRFGTPLYVYSRQTITDHFERLDAALGPVDHQICFAVKANSNLSVLKTLAGMGAGFDIVSSGELQRVIQAGGDPAASVFAGTGKSHAEIELALRKGIYCFNVESEPELDRIQEVAARLKKVAPFAVRVNPDIAAGTHAKITTGTYENKFGIAFERVAKVYAYAAKLKNLRARGVQMHIGSQLTEVAPFEAAVRKVAPLVQRLARKCALEFFSIGGGIGIVYRPALDSGATDWWQSAAAQTLLTPAKYAATLVPLLKPLNLRILVEPGRFIVGNAGALVTRVEYVKRTGHKNFAIVDAAMNDLLRPAMYDSFHEIVPIRKRAGVQVEYDVVGPICESGDCFAKRRSLPRLREGDLLALMSAGAYGFAMASNYNSRPFPPEILVHRKRVALVRERQKPDDLWRDERIPNWL